MLAVAAAEDSTASQAIMGGMVDVLIGVGGTLLGAAVGVGGALTISREDRRHAAREDLRRALAVYLGALYPSVSELKELPPTRPEPALARWLTRLERDDVRWLRQRRREHLGARRINYADRQ